MATQLDAVTVVTRLLLATLFSGIIGVDRAYKHRPAGLRTHILVCLGACIIALIQKNLGFNALMIAQKYPQYKGIVRVDEARLIAQVVSGIGFLGAGTIIVQNHSVRGLTTAASLWVVACMGIAIGMGDYIIAISSFLVVFGVVAFLKKIIRINPVRKLKIEYRDKSATKEFINDYFKENNISIEDVKFRVANVNNHRVYTNVYAIDFDKTIDYVDIVENLSMNDNIVKIETINV